MTFDVTERLDVSELVRDETSCAGGELILQDKEAGFRFVETSGEYGCLRLGSTYSVPANASGFSVRLDGERSQDFRATGFIQVDYLQALEITKDSGQEVNLHLIDSSDRREYVRESNLGLRMDVADTREIDIVWHFEERTELDVARFPTVQAGNAFTASVWNVNLTFEGIPAYLTAKPAVDSTLTPGSEDIVIQTLTPSIDADRTVIHVGPARDVINVVLVADNERIPLFSSSEGIWSAVVPSDQSALSIHVTRAISPFEAQRSATIADTMMLLVVLYVSIVTVLWWRRREIIDATTAEPTPLPAMMAGAIAAATGTIVSAFAYRGSLLLWPLGGADAFYLTCAFSAIGVAAGAHVKVAQLFSQAQRKNLRSVQAHAKQLQLENKQLSELARIAHHDLQGPLRSITLGSQLLEREIREKNDRNALKHARLLTEQALQLGRLVQDLPEYTDAANRPLSYANVELKALAMRAKQMLAHDFRIANAKLRCERLPVIKADAVMLLRAFQNLMQNSLRYRDANRPLRIRVWAKAEGNGYRIGFDDNGMGIPRHHHDRVWRIHERLERNTQADGDVGSGMGLALVQRIVERHGGRVFIQDRPTGVRIGMWLPSLPAQDPGLATDQPAPVQQSSPRHQALEGGQFRRN